MPRRDLGRSYRLVVAVVRPLLMLLTRREWHGAENLPTQGGFVVCANHISHADPMTFGHFLLDSGHPPYFLAKESLFTIPVMGRVIRGAGQIPVHRDSADAAAALASAATALREGKCIAMYPEGTLTRDPGLWPMMAKSGAARLALETGCQVVPVAQWGAQQLLSPYSARLKLWPRPVIQVVAGNPVHLEDLRGREVDAQVLAEASERIMAAITELLRPLRSGEPPAQRFDPRERGQSRFGNPAKAAQDAARAAQDAARAARRAARSARDRAGRRAS